MSLLHASDISYRHEGQGDPVFSAASFDVDPGDRVGLVGPNGSGKTTLLRLIAGELAPTSGEIARRRGLRVVHARQEVAPDPATPAGGYVLGARPDVAEARAELARLEAAIDDDASAIRYAERLAAYEEIGGYAFETRVGAVLDALGIDERGREIPLGALSSGQRSRAQLARLLLAPADLLLLDEPTNHLDAAARAWLEEFLVSAEPALVVVSHDRRLLDRVTTRTFELRRGVLSAYAGNLAEARARREVEERHAWEAYEARERKVAAARRASEARMRVAAKVLRTPPGVRHSQDFYGAKAARVQRTARILRERAAREERAEKPWTEPPRSRLDFAHVRRAGGDAVACEGVVKRFGEAVVLDGIDLRVAGDERCAVVGPNGAGKSTLLRIVAGLGRADAGEARVGAGVRAGYFAQNAEHLDDERSALAACVDAGGADSLARTVLACLRIRGEMATRPLRSLSPGERSRVAIARLLVSGANLLLLDEPTNHLDLDAREALEETLEGFPGAILFVSHDRELVSRLATSVLELPGI
jgi:ATP-binding cassette subfamily F protein 3